VSVTSERPWPARSVVRRLGPSVLVVALLAAVAVGSTVEGRAEPTEKVSGPSLEKMRTYAENPDLPITYDEAKEAGTLDDYDWGDRCDTTRQYNDTEETLARIAIPSSYAPPCVPVWDGRKPWVSTGGDTFSDNGGETTRGVSEDTIRVVMYLPAEQDITKQLEQFGVLDSNRKTADAITKLVEMSNHLYEMYGRRVELIPFHASGDGRSSGAAKADAVKVVEMDVFASIGGPNQTSAYQHELALRGVLCIQCGYASTDDVLAVGAPYSWGYLATPDQLLDGVFSLGAASLNGAPAQYAGDPVLQKTPRKFGTVHYEQDPPIFGPLKKSSIAKFEDQGVDTSVVLQYILDPNSLNAQAQAIIGRLKREGITSVVFLGDPLMPRLLMQQATAQDYFPEWMFTGTVFTDTTAIGRLYDQRQMAHAFGASSAAARTAPEISESWKLYEWWYGEQPDAPRTMLFWGPVVQLLFQGIHMAGPHLSAETFAGGLFNYPDTGGTNTEGLDGIELLSKNYLAGDTTPAVSFGPRGDDEAVDFVAVDDYTVVWWDADSEGPDENGVVGKGMWKYTGHGLRLPLRGGSFPPGVGEDFLFKDVLKETGSELADLAPELPIAEDILEKTPPLNALPEYKSFPESPACAAGASTC
jgi:hypothetical protein